MHPFLAFARDIAATLWPTAVVFATLALATKRAAILVTLRRCRAECATNIVLFVVNYIVLAPLMLVPVAAVRGIIPAVPAFTRFWRALPQPACLIMALVLIELAAYARHRFEHQPAIWRFHATHHADEELNWLSVLRKHPVSKFMDLLIDTLLVILLGLPLWAILAAQLVRGWWGHFIHADLPWTLGPLGRWVVSPAAHRLHHIRDETLMGANYGNMLTLWDRVFATWRDPAPYLGCVTGIAEGTRGAWGELIRPWEGCYRSKRSAPGSSAATPA